MMKKRLLLTLFSIMAISLSYSQSNSDIANVYIKRANTVIEESIDYKEALVLFEKAMKYMDTITSPKIAKLGARIYFELEKYEQAKKYSQQYFLISHNKNSEEYIEELDMFVTIKEKIEVQKEKERKLELERIKKEKELKKIDSLKTVWKKTSDKLSIKVDSIFSFNKNKYALFLKNKKFGIINDVGEVIVDATEFSYGVSFGGYILLQNKKDNPTKIYYFNTYKGSGANLPIPSDFNSISTHYGKVMLPRANGRLITYPNSAYEPLVFDLNKNIIVRVSNKEELLKTLKKNDIIRKSKKDVEVKIDKDWYLFGGHIGGGVHPLYEEDNYQVKAYLFSVGGKVLPAESKYKYLGAFDNSKMEAVEGNATVWINQKGEKVNDLKDKFAKYDGDAKVVKLEEGVYQINKNGKITKGTETLEKMADYLRKFN